MADVFSAGDAELTFNGYPMYRIFTGPRCDSGDPIDFIRFAKEMYTRYGILGTSNRAGPSAIVMFSDSLTPDSCVKCCRAAADAGFRAVCAMAGSLTSAFYPSRNITLTPLRLLTSETDDFPDEVGSPNIVFKLHVVAGNHTVKISDEPSRAVGDAETIRAVSSMVSWAIRLPNSAATD